MTKSGNIEGVFEVLGSITDPSVRNPQENEPPVLEYVEESIELYQVRRNADTCIF